MKIAFYMTTILEHGGGLEKYLKELAKNLSNCDDIHVDVITMDDKFSFKILNWLRFYYFKIIDKKSLFRESLEDITKYIEKAKYIKIDNLDNLKNILNEYDVVYSRNEILEAFIFKFLIGYKNLPPIIFGCHTPVYYSETKTIQSKLHNFLYNGIFYKTLSSGVSKFHVINTFEEKQYSHLFPHREVIKIYYPFDFKEFINNAQKYLYKYTWDKTKFNIIWVGRLTEQKGVDDLVYIINNVNESKYIDKIIWNICGDGPEINKILNLRKWKNVNYFGYVENKYMASIYKENSLFISTSHWEGFPYNILEAQSAGLPVLAYNISGCNDIIDNNLNGVLVKDINHFKNEILNFVKYKYYFLNNNKYITQKFDQNLIYKRLFNLFKSVADGNIYI